MNWTNKFSWMLDSIERFESFSIEYIFWKRMAFAIIPKDFVIINELKTND